MADRDKRAGANTLPILTGYGTWVFLDDLANPDGTVNCVEKADRLTQGILNNSGQEVSG